MTDGNKEFYELGKKIFNRLNPLGTPPLSIDKNKDCLLMVEMAIKNERVAILQTIEILYDSEDPVPMYQAGYNHALDQIKIFIESRKTHE